MWDTCRLTNKGIEEIEFSTGTLLDNILKNESSHFTNGFLMKLCFTILFVTLQPILVVVFMNGN